MIVFFDMDGVVADFVGGARRHFRREDIPISDIRWGIEDQFGVEPAAFWGQLGREFWAGLPALGDGLQLLSMVEAAVGASRIAILTSPCSTDGCYDGKRDWVRRWIPQHARHLFAGSAKGLLGAPGKILVDDHDPNCESFLLSHDGRASGGIAVTPPRPWNARRAECGACGEFSPEATFAEIAKYL